MKLIETIQGKMHAVPPLWIMRQAGRYLPEFRELRKRKPAFMDFCASPELAAEVTLQPLKRFDLDAAIIFSDILMVPHGLGQHVTFLAGEGPSLEKVDTLEGLDRLSSDIIREKVVPTLQAIKMVRKDLDPALPLIGFAGAPWTILTYMIEGGGSRGKGHYTTLSKLLDNPLFLERILRRVIDATTQYLLWQIEAGVNVVKIFDSWASSLPAHLQKRFTWDPLLEIVQRIREKYPDFPIILFPKGVNLSLGLASHLLPKGVALACDDSHTPGQLKSLATERRTPIQSGISPALLMAGKDFFQEQVDHYKEAFNDAPFIFNLAHGILPDTPIDHVKAFIDAVKGQRYD